MTASPTITLGGAGEVASGHGGAGVATCLRQGAAQRRQRLARVA